MTNRSLQRRQFLQAGTAAAVASTVPGWSLAEPDSAPRIVTVTGEISASQLGPMLPHEHVLVDFIGADQASPDRYDRDEAFTVILPHLQRVRELGCRSLAECTPAFLGRDPLLLRRLAQATGLQLLTNTGYYGARQGKFLPDHADTEDADSLASRWLQEWQDGIGGSGIRPGFIKIGVDAGPLSAVNRKLVQAAARTHLQSGLTIAGHTGDGAAALEQMQILRREGVAAAAWIWVHSQNERDTRIHRRIAEQGGWISLDGVAPDTIDRHRDLVLSLRAADQLSQVLISHDAGWYSVGEPGGGDYRGYEALFTGFLPALKQAGLSDEELKLLTVTNPARAFAISVRPV